MYAPIGRISDFARPTDGVRLEHAWRCQPTQDDSDGISFARWRLHGNAPRIVEHAGITDAYCVAIAMAQTTLVLKADDRPIWSGRLPEGSIQITAPGVHTRATFEGASDVLHMFIPCALVTGWHDTHASGAPVVARALNDPTIFRDAHLHALSATLIKDAFTDAVFGDFYEETIGLAIVARLTQVRAPQSNVCKKAVSPLASWRLQRVLDFAEAHLSGAITLADMAKVSGITCMHFAAQFRAKTGMRPHEYVLRMRIERAQNLLLDPEHSLIDIAQACGFRSQPHFTSVFKRFVGAPPQQWRRSAPAASLCQRRHDPVPPAFAHLR